MLKIFNLPPEKKAWFVSELNDIFFDYARGYKIKNQKLLPGKIGNSQKLSPGNLSIDLFLDSTQLRL